MDAPNAPNPANPNAQDPADQNQDQVPVGQAPAQGPVQIMLKMYLSNQYHNWCNQPLLVQPAPQIFYQNWIGIFR